MDTPKTDNNTITYAAQTDTGKQRTNNEDNWVCRNIWDENTLIAAVIDGVGGYEGGEVAAKIAAEELVSYLEKYPNGERAQLLKELPKKRGKLSRETQALADRAKELLVELAEISPEIVQMAVAKEGEESLPGWFIIEAVRDIPALSKRRN